MDKSRLENLLLSIDEEAALSLGSTEEKPRVVIAGGSAFMLHDVTRRPATHDVDILSADERIRAFLERYPEVNGAISAFCDSIPYNFEDRLVPIPLDTTAVVFLTPSLEDLAVMKLYAWRPNDQADLTSPLFLERIDWKLLDHLVYSPDEAQASSLVPRRYREMVATYEQYREEYRRESDV